MPVGVPDTLKMIEALGYDSVFTAESWGSDAISPLAWWGAGTFRGRRSLARWRPRVLRVTVAAVAPFGRGMPRSLRQSSPAQKLARLSPRGH
ncbi:MAG: LLM class flavin-dependent oxidoreductase [Actinobacteria bacterium]|nr:LLM class flavin-dependent oxidoreductase [Actinomycetota bacterium]